MTSRIPVRWRLTLWYVGLLALTLAIFSGLFYFGLRHLLNDSLETTLRDQATLVSNTVIVQDGAPSLTAVQIRSFQQNDRIVWLFDSQGAPILDTSQGSDNDFGMPSGVAVALRGNSEFQSFDAGGDHIRVLVQPIMSDSAVVGVLAVGVESDIGETLGFALSLIAISGPLILIFAAGGGYWLAGRALDPIDRITRTAADIGEHDLAQRITLALPDDELGRLVRTFNSMLARIDHAFHRQRRFTADAAHELRTPLALMHSQIELALAQTRDSDQDQHTLEILRMDVDRLTRLTTSLLALARSDAYGIEIVREQVDLEVLLGLIAEQYAGLAESEEVGIVVDAKPAALLADGDQLIQVLVNLVDNALRHAPDKSKLTLGCRQRADEVRVWVADEGPGIAAEHLDQLFERFYRVEPDRDRQRGGAGLGLSISRAIVEAHGGSIEVESAPGRGTTFTFRLPRST